MSRTKGQSDPELVAMMTEYRIKNGFSQPQFAARAGIASSVVSHLEIDPNKTMSRSTRLKIIYALSGGIVGQPDKTEE